jgi:hypothetical protein
VIEPAPGRLVRARGNRIPGFNLEPFLRETISMQWRVEDSLGGPHYQFVSTSTLSRQAPRPRIETQNRTAALKANA